MKLSMTTAAVRGGEAHSLEINLKTVIADKSLPTHCRTSLKTQFHPLTQLQAHHLLQLEPAEATALFQDSNDSPPF